MLGVGYVAQQPRQGYQRQAARTRGEELGKIEFRGQALSDEPFPAVFRVTGSSLTFRARTAELAQGAGDGRFVVVAVEVDRLVGIGKLVISGAEEASIHDLIVDPEFRGLGIGSRILRMLVEWCDERQIRDIRLSATRASHGFFERNGFAPHTDSETEMRYSRGGAPIATAFGVGWSTALSHVELDELTK